MAGLPAEVRFNDFHLRHILPVIDLKDGVVVHGVAGKRDEYQPIVSELTSSSSPASVAEAIAHCGFRSVYVADLDAIQRGEPDLSALAAIQATGLSVWLDGGMAATGLDGFAISRTIVGLESLESIHQLDSLRVDYPNSDLVFSLDLMHGQPMLQKAKSLKGEMTVDTVVDRFESSGLRSIIVLDLAAVGLQCGPVTHDLCRRLKGTRPELEIISGGGVRDLRDVESLVGAGCDRVLVASALHNGAIGGHELL